jgi:hypothetical protein
VDEKPPAALTRIGRDEVSRLPAERIRSARTAAVYWTGSGFAPALVTGWCRFYGGWFVRLRVRRDIWRDREDWYAYSPGRLMPVDLDQRDLQDWLPARRGN